MRIGRRSVALVIAWNFCERQQFLIFFFLNTFCILFARNATRRQRVCVANFYLRWIPSLYWSSLVFWACQSANTRPRQCLHRLCLLMDRRRKKGRDVWIAPLWQSNIEAGCFNMKPNTVQTRELCPSGFDSVDPSPIAAHTAIWNPHHSAHIVVLSLFRRINATFIRCETSAQCRVGWSLICPNVAVKSLFIADE